MVGREVSHFRVQSRIGEGGMGEVYLAQDLSLGRRVALKFVTAPAAHDPDAGRRLLREAQAVAALDHPFICKIYEAGESGGRTYLAMEFIEGETLQQRLARGPLTPGEAIRLGVEIAEAMACAHAHGIIHRDLKPSNVMVSVEGHVKVMDFGIAKRMPAADALEQETALSTLTVPGLIAGTLAYSSPEQLRGLPLDARSDVFSFGILLYEMLTARHPFYRESLGGMVDALLNAPPPPLSATAGEVPPLLEHVLFRCLEKDPGRRFTSFHDVLVELQTPRSAAVLVPPASRPGRRRLAIATAVLATAAVAAGIWYEPDWLHLTEPALAFNARDWIIITDCENLTADPVFDRSLGLALDVGIAQSSYVNVYSRDRLQSTLQRMRRNAPARVDLALASDVAQRDNLRAVLTCSIGRIGDTYSIAGRVVDPRTQRIALTESVEAARKDDVLAALSQLASRLRRRLGESLATISTQNVPLPQATTSSLEALKMFADSMRIDKRPGEGTSDQLLRQAIELDADFAMAHAVLGHHYFLSSEPARRLEGEQHIARALALSNRLTTRERLLIQASADDARGNREQAAIEYRSYLSQYPDDTPVWFRLGWTYMAGLAQFQNAIEAFDRVIRIDPRDTAALINLATCHAGLRQYGRAVEMYEKAFAQNPDEMLGMYVNSEYGASLMQLGRNDEAERAFSKMAAAPASRARGLRSLAFLNMYRGHYAAAQGMLREAIALNQAAAASVSVFRDRLILARSLLATGAIADARRELDAIDALVARQPFGPEWLAPLAKLRARLGHVAQAERLVSKISATLGNATIASSANRSISRDEGFLELARAEVDVARHRPADAASRAAAAAGKLQRVALDTVAFAAAAAGRRDEAVARYAELIAQPLFVIEAQEDWFDAHLALGTLYEQAGRPADARRLYEHVLALWTDGDPDLVLLRSVRARLAALERQPRRAGSTNQP